MPDVLHDTAAAIEARMKELMDEHKRLSKALDAIRSVGGVATGRSDGRGRRRASANGRRPGRPHKGQPTRRDEFVQLVQQHPGITVSQAAKELKMPKPNALYAVAREATKSGQVTKRGSGYHPAAKAKTAKK